MVLLAQGLSGSLREAAIETLGPAETVLSNGLPGAASEMAPWLPGSWREAQFLPRPFHSSLSAFTARELAFSRASDPRERVRQKSHSSWPGLGSELYRSQTHPGYSVGGDPTRARIPEAGIGNHLESCLSQRLCFR